MTTISILTRSRLKELQQQLGTRSTEIIRTSLRRCVTTTGSTKEQKVSFTLGRHQQQQQQLQQLRSKHNYNKIQTRKTSSSSSKSVSASSNSSGNKTRWPSSFKAFVTGTPIVTRQLPYLGRVTIDFGTSMMNFGAITSLTGFMMTDVLKLRTLSIVGSLCGVVYNITRTPRQLNAVAWGGVFISVNVIQIIRLLMERQEIKFTVDEANLYYRRFEPHGVTPIQFQKLMSKFGKWKKYKSGEVLVKDGKALENVIILADGKATAIEPSSSSPSSGISLFSYSSTEDNGQIIGATGLVDSTIIGKPYPHRIVADQNSLAVIFPTKKLQQFLKEDNPSLNAAILHMMYVDFQRSVNHRRPSIEGSNGNNGDDDENDNTTTKAELALHELKLLLRMACATGTVHDKERSIIHNYRKQNPNISQEQFVDLLQSNEVGNWTIEDWKNGTKETTVMATGST